MERSVGAVLFHPFIRIMCRTEMIINEEQTKKKLQAVSDTGNYSQRLDDRCYSTLQVLAKNDSFTSACSDQDEDPKTSTRQSCCGLLCLSLALVACTLGCYVMWGTNFFTLMVHQNVVISNNSMRYEAWKSPPVHAFLRVYIFNFTNVDEFERGNDPKLKVRELGPYTYIEKLERVDVRFNQNGTATYRDKKTYKFSPSHSRGNESDIIVVPNLPFLAALSFMSEMSAFFRWPLLSLLNSMGGHPFISLKVDEFLWGYEDTFSILAKKLLSFTYDLPFKKFGILSAKNQTQKDLVTIYTGEDDPSKTGIVAIYDGQTSLNYWNSQECNRIDGTDGTVYPPPLVHPNSTLYIYLKDLCRKLPLVYSKQYLDKHGIPVLRFHVPKTVFASGREHKDNLCFCSQSSHPLKCLPSGIFNVGPCVYKAPIVTSLPHFLYGDPVLSKGIEGLHPKVKKHESYVEVDPKMGIPVGGKSRLQLNILLSGGSMSAFKYRDQMLFPIAWMDYGVDRLPDDISAMIKGLLSFIKVADYALSYGFIISVVVLSLLFATSCREAARRRERRRKEKATGSETPLVVVHEKR